MGLDSYGVRVPMPSCPMSLRPQQQPTWAAVIAHEYPVPTLSLVNAGLVGGRVPAQWTVPLASRPQGPYGPELNATSAAPPIPTRNGVEATVALPSRLPQQYMSPLATRPQA